MVLYCRRNQLRGRVYRSCHSIINSQTRVYCEARSILLGVGPAPVRNLCAVFRQQLPILTLAGQHQATALVVAELFPLVFAIPFPTTAYNRRTIREVHLELSALSKVQNVFRRAQQFNQIVARPDITFRGEVNVVVAENSLNGAGVLSVPGFVKCCHGLKDLGFTRRSLPWRKTSDVN